MENSVIAVQIANGTFVPVLNTSSRKRRRLVLTTVRDSQTNVQIELFRGSDESMSDPEYVGSLVIDNVEAAEKGSADISVLLGVDEDGNLNATATDTKSGEYQSLSVGLEELEQGDHDVPDFQLSDDELTLDELSLDEDEPFEMPGFEEETGAEPAAEPSTTPGEDEEPLGDFDLGDFETELETDEGSGEEEPAEATGDVAETPSQPPEPTEVEDLDLELGDEASIDEASSDEASLEELGEVDLDELGLGELDLGELEGEEAEDVGTEQPVSSDAEASLDEEPGELDLSGLEEELEEETDELDLSGLGEDLEPAPATPEAQSGGGLEEFSFDDLEAPGEVALGEEAEAPAESPAPAEELTEQADTLGDISEEDFSFDESFSEEFTGTQTGEPAPAEGDGDLDLSSLTAEEGGGEDEFNIDADFEEGMVEADLGEEDFTFDEGAEDEPLFGEPEGEPEPEPELELESSAGGAEIEDTLSPEEFDRLDSQPVSTAQDLETEEEPVAPRRSNAIIFVGYIVLALAALGVLTYLVFRLLEGPPAPPLRASLLENLALGSIVWGRPIIHRRAGAKHRRCSTRLRG